MSDNHIPADVQEAADRLYEQANEDLDKAVDDLAVDMRQRTDEDEAMCFGFSLVTIHEHITQRGNIGDRLHAVYVAALYRLARQQVSMMRDCPVCGMPVDICRVGACPANSFNQWTDTFTYQNVRKNNG